MTKRTPPSDRNTLNCMPFRAGAALLKTVFSTFGPPELAAKHPAKHGQPPQLRENVAQPQHHGPKLTGLASRFPHKSQPAPAASS